MFIKKIYFFSRNINWFFSMAVTIMKTMFLAIKEKGRCDHLTILPSEVIVLYVEVLFACSTLITNVMMSFLVDIQLLVRIQWYVYITPKISVCCLPSLSFKAQLWKNVHNMINSTERSDILVFNCYLCHIRFLSICYVRSTKIGENSDISKYFEDIVSQALGFIKRFYAAELRY